MSRNDITGDELKTKHSTPLYRDNHDRIFGRKCKRCGEVNPAEIHTCSPQQYKEENEASTN